MEKKEQGATTEHSAALRVELPVVAPIAGSIARSGTFVLVLAMGALAGYGIVERMHDARSLARESSEQAVPVVIVQQPKQSGTTQELTLPANVMPYMDSAIRARTGGYLQHWYYDIGAHVKKGALLASISAPEVDHQLAQAEAELEQDEAMAHNARSLSERYGGLVQSNAVARQDADTFHSQASAQAALVRAAEANVKRLKDLQSFEKVYAPFDGIITARDTDPGQLIDQSSTRELFHMQATEKLRVYANVPESYVQGIKQGQKVSLSLTEYAGKVFTGTLVRSTGSLDAGSRTLLVEIEVNNADGQILPGALAQAHFSLKMPMASLTVPVTALIFRSEGLRVAIVHNGVVHLQPVSIGHDDGQTAQIDYGLNASDMVITNPPDSVVEGQKVRPVSPARSGK